MPFSNDCGCSFWFSRNQFSGKERALSQWVAGVGCVRTYDCGDGNSMGLLHTNSNAITSKQQEDLMLARSASLNDHEANSVHRVL
ncbi:hypothetical protein Taro_016877 [Colocasia esculenta]|uniref:Uncharacterized protein n=1 Tax=Colocasia esculenta TaxID=4460 RepID=A0A843URI1_COLES|nr:hypothetical protein [Colocasia esculenta]